ncbi:MAG TPA: TrkA C-terminal domain-containing protein [Terrimicrobiaceae bacterium]
MFQERLRRMPKLLEGIHPIGPSHRGVADRGIFALVNPERLRRILPRALDENEFLSPHGHLVTDRRDLAYLRVFASCPTVVGRTLDLNLPGEKASVLVQVRRGDTDILPRPDLVLAFGDRVGVLAHRCDFTAMRKYFGDSIKGTSEERVCFPQGGPPGER